MPVVGTVFSATGPGALGWSAWEEGPWHSPSLCARPALCTDQVRRADWSPAPRVLLTFPWQPYSQEPLAPAGQRVTRYPQVPTAPGREASVGRPEVGNTHLPRILREGSSPWLRWGVWSFGFIQRTPVPSPSDWDAARDFSLSFGFLISKMGI